MELSPNLMVLDQDVNDRERGTTVDPEKRADVTNPVVEIVMMIIIERGAENEKDIGIVTETVIENVIESESIATVKRS